MRRTVRATGSSSPRRFLQASLDLAGFGPLAGCGALYTDVGGLLSYGASIVESHRRAATYVDKILKGAKPADLPVEQPTVFDFVINLNTAWALGLSTPGSTLVKATHVFDCPVSGG